MCLYPRIIENRKYRANKKNGGVIPPLTDQRIKYVPIGCQTCIECRKQKSRGWKIRLMEEVKHRKNGKFITLTFNTESLKKIVNGEGYTIGKRSTTRKNRRGNIWNIPYKHKDRRNQVCTKSGYDLDNEICTKAIRNFNERWRKKYGKALRHWLITELGNKGHSEHVHLHGIIWATNEQMEELEKIWSYGYVWRGYKKRGKLDEIIYENYVTEKTVNYITKYVTKIDEKHLNYKPIILTSPGIGSNYNTNVHRFKGQKTVETYRTSTGHKIALPIYWRNKAFTEEEREKLWIQKLDQGDRYVCGEKTNTNESMDTYYNLLYYHQKRTISLGYIPPEWIWKAKYYEEQRRQLIHKKRIGPPAGY